MKMIQALENKLRTSYSQFFANKAEPKSKESEERPFRTLAYGTLGGIFGILGVMAIAGQPQDAQRLTLMSGRDTMAVYNNVKVWYHNSSEIKYRTREGTCIWNGNYKIDLDTLANQK